MAYFVRTSVSTALAEYEELAYGTQYALVLNSLKAKFVKKITRALSRQLIKINYYT